MSQIANFFRETFHVFSSAVRPAAKSVRENTGLAALSIVLAFGIWVGVTQADNPSRSTVVPIDIPVEAINVPANAAVVQPLNTVRVRVTAPDTVIEGLSAGDFLATIDLTNYTVGDLLLNVTVTSSRSNLRIDSVIPKDGVNDQLKVTLAELRSKQIDVSVDVQGSPASDYTMGAPDPDVTTVTVSGPQQFVSRVSKVVASINVDGRTDDVDQSVHLVPRSESGELIQGVTLTPALTGLRVPIQQQKFSRSVVVSPQIVGTPATGYNIVSVSLSPPIVTISGSQSLINGTTTMPTKSIDLDNATADVVKTVSLDLPSGAEVSGGPPTVTVTIKIAPATGTFTFAVPVSAVNLSSDVAITGALPSVNVTLFGPLPVLQDLSPNDILASVDLSGEGAGQHTKKVTITPPTGATVRTITPTEIQVTLEKR
ncbi:MAG: CdaR family protein [Chloroflexota bacterium]